MCLEIYPYIKIVLYQIFATQDAPLTQQRAQKATRRPNTPGTNSHGVGDSPEDRELLEAYPWPPHYH